MQKALQNRSSLFPVFATVLLTALAGCTTSGTNNAGGTAAGTEAGQQRVKESELRAYCPSVSLRDGTAFFSTYDRGDKTAENVIYQASLTDTTRSCQYGEGTITIDIAAAGKVVPGPKYRSGAITMPIRVAVRQGDQVIFSKLLKQSVTVNSNTATQFVFNEKGISVPSGQQNIQIFVGFDEGPYNTK